MQSAMASLRIHRINEAFRNATENTINKLCGNPACTVRVSSKVARHVLITHPTLLARGRLYSTQVKNVGAGVKEPYLKLANP